MLLDADVRCSEKASGFFDSDSSGNGNGIRSNRVTSVHNGAHAVQPFLGSWKCLRRVYVSPQA